MNLPTLNDICGSATTMQTGLLPDDGRAPTEYLQFAEQDLEEADTGRTRVNALSNAKRALHWQLELITDALGYTRWPGGTRGGFPRRLEFAEECGIITPRVLLKVNRLRNETEHDYKIPGRDVVEDFVDVVALFLAATETTAKSLIHVRGLKIAPQPDKDTWCARLVMKVGVIEFYNVSVGALICSFPKSAGPMSSIDRTTPQLGSITAQGVLDIRSDTGAFFAWLPNFTGRPTWVG